MSEKRKNEIPPLLNLRVSNPVEYIKAWWKKVIANEGVDFRFHIRPLTAIFITLAVASVGFGVGHFVMPFSIPFFNFEQANTSPTPTPTPTDWKETAYTGTLQYSETTKKYFLTTSSASEAITLNIPDTVSISSLIGKRILIIGSYNKQTRTFIVSDAKDMEVLTKSPVPVPTNTPSPTATPDEATPSPSTEASPTPAV